MPPGILRRRKQAEASRMSKCSADSLVLPAACADALVVAHLLYGRSIEFDALKQSGDV